MNHSPKPEDGRPHPQKKGVPHVVNKKKADFTTPAWKAFQSLFENIGPSGSSGYKERVVACVRAAFNAGAPSSTDDWIHTQKLAGLYKRASRANFFGQKNWIAFLEHEVGLVPHHQVGKYLQPLQHTEESLRSFIRSRAKDTHMSVDHWNKTKGLNGVYLKLLQQKFYGKKGWRDYLQSQGITPAPLRPRRRKK